MEFGKKRNKKKFPIKIFVVFFLIIFSLGLLIYLNFHFKTRNINIEFFDEKAENVDIKNSLNDLVRKNSNSFLGFVMLDEKNITKLLHDNYPIVGDIQISKSYKMDLSVSVKKNEEFFYTCVPESLGFLVNCMLGNIDGIYYQEIDSNATSTEEGSKKINIEINPKVLFDVASLKKVDSPDSLSGTRIYTKEDFLILREMINWMQKNAFKIGKVYVNELKIADIYTDFYTLKVNLDKGYADTVKDFELISRAGKLQEYINEDKEKIDYIDLSYKNKVFYKLKGESEVTTATTTTATTTTATTTASTTNIQ